MSAASRTKARPPILPQGSPAYGPRRVMPVRFGKPPKRTKRSRPRVAPDEDDAALLCVNISSVDDDDDASAAVASARDVEPSSFAWARLPALPEKDAASTAWTRGADTAKLTKTHATRFDAATGAYAGRAEKGRAEKTSRGCDVDSPWRRVAGAPRLRRG